MHRLQLIALVLLHVSSASARADHRELPWLAADKLPKNVKLHAAGKLAKPAVVEVNASDTATQILDVADPKAPSHHYMLKGKVKYKGVDKTAYLEMWSHFADDKAYFSRTLGDQGPSMKIEGDSDWRDIAVTFVSKEDYLPTKLVVNVVLPGEGTIYLTTLTLTKTPDEDK